MDLELTGKVAIVTGGTRGIGFATARTLHGEGCRVAVTGRTGKTPQALTDWLTEAADVMVLSADMSVPETASRVVSEVVARFGRVDLLVNNAASFSEADVFESGYEEWERIFRVKVFGYVAMIRAVIPEMERQGGGAVVNVSGVAGVMPIATSAHAGAANAAVLNLTSLLARQLAPRGIRVNAVIPGSVRTDRYEARLAAAVESGLTPSEANDRLARETPTGQPVHPDELAVLIVTMCSPRLSSLVGAEVVVDGGRSC